MKREPGILAKIRSARTNEWLGALDDQPRPILSPEETLYLEPNFALVRRMIDEELTDAIVGDSDSRLGQMAASEMRRREAWRTPARWTLVISLIALLVSIASLAIALGES